MCCITCWPWAVGGAGTPAACRTPSGQLLNRHTKQHSARTAESRPSPPPAVATILEWQQQQQPQQQHQTTPTTPTTPTPPTAGRPKALCTRTGQVHCDLESNALSRTIMAHDPVGVGQCVSHGCGEAGGRRAGEVQLEQVERSRGEGVLVWSVEAVEAAAAAAVSTTHGGGQRQTGGNSAAKVEGTWAKLVCGTRVPPATERCRQHLMVNI